MNARKTLVHVAGVALLFSMSAFAQDSTAQKQESTAQKTDKPTAAKKTSMDQKFVVKAAQGGMAEVDLGNVAKQNGSNDAVKQFGDRMVTDHSKANDELKSLAQQKNWTLPSEPNASDKSKKDRLSKMTGADFDKAYMRDMVQDHQKDVKEFQKCAASCSDPDLKAWAAKTVPTLQDHLKMAQDGAKQVGAMNGSKSNKTKKSGDEAAPSGKPSGALQ
jgi:putative membrane protein